MSDHDRLCNESQRSNSEFPLWNFRRRINSNGTFPRTEFRWCCEKHHDIYDIRHGYFEYSEDLQIFVTLPQSLRFAQSSVFTSLIGEKRINESAVFFLGQFTFMYSISFD